MKKKIISLLVLGLSIGMMGCGGEKPVKEDKEEIPQQFEMLSNERVENEDGYCCFDLIIVKHKETGKRFIIYDDYRRGGICPLD